MDNSLKIIVGITGGIGAYKIPELVRRLRELGHQVRVVMTRAACEFITPLTLQSVSGNPVSLDLFSQQSAGGMEHIELARWADKVLVAPAAANSLSKLAHGLADDLLSTLCLATTAPIYLAPAMNQQMWQHPATQANVALLKERRALILGPGVGSQACGEFGPGRMLEPEQLLVALTSQSDFCQKRVLITAGATREPLDPVRFLSNRSSGKMGYALATEAQARGAEVILVSGPSSLAAPSGVTTIHVETAQEMLDAVLAQVGSVDLFISTAAVADYRVATPAAGKGAKQQQVTLQLLANPDIVATVTARAEKPFCVGFAAETEQVKANALNKLQRKGLDMIAANQVAVPDRGFDVDNNELLVLYPDGKEQRLPFASKRQLAEQLLTLISERMRVHEKVTS